MKAREHRTILKSATSERDFYIRSLERLVTRQRDQIARLEAELERLDQVIGSLLCGDA